MSNVKTTVDVRDVLRFHRGAVDADRLVEWL